MSNQQSFLCKQLLLGWALQIILIFKNQFLLVHYFFTATLRWQFCIYIIELVGTWFNSWAIQGKHHDLKWEKSEGLNKCRAFSRITGSPCRIAEWATGLSGKAEVRCKGMDWSQLTLTIYWSIPFSGSRTWRNGRPYKAVLAIQGRLVVRYRPSTAHFLPSSDSWLVTDDRADAVRVVSERFKVRVRARPAVIRVRIVNLSSVGAKLWWEALGKSQH